MLVTGGKNAGDFLRLLGNGRDFGSSMLRTAVMVTAARLFLSAVI